MATDTTNPLLTGGSLIDTIGTQMLNATTKSALLLTQAPGDEQARHTGVPRDSDWIRQSFIIGTTSKNSAVVALDPNGPDLNNRYFTSALLKYTDASIGGNTCINPPPQYTRTADIRYQSLVPNSLPASIRLAKTPGSIGQGRAYAEKLDDNKQEIHLRFGVPTFNGLTQFFTGFYSGALGSAARTARMSDDIWKNFFVFAGNAIGLAIAPLFLVPMGIMFLGQAARYFANVPGSKFCYLKPAMPLYWNTVSSMVNAMASYSGLLTFVNTDQAQSLLKGGDGVDLQKTTVTNLVNKFIPDNIVRDDGTIDVYAIANRSNRMHIAFEAALSKAIQNAPKNAWHAAIRQFVANTPKILSDVKPKGIEVYLEEMKNSLFHTDNKKDTVEKDFRIEGYDTGTAADGSTEGSKATYSAPESTAGKIASYLIGNWNDGSEFATFRVDYTGTVSDSFSNTATDSGLASRINDMSRSNREKRINLADGTTGIPPIDAIGNAVRDLAGGVAEVVHFDGLMALAGSAYVDIPKNWADSQTSFGKSTYTMTLMSPYGNPISRMFDIWIPLAMLLSGTLPLATGKQSHTAPFMCELHDRGRMITRYGMISDLSIARGVSNLGWTTEGNALAIEVTFSVIDLSSILAVPIQPGFSFSAAVDSLFDGDNAFSDYLMTLAGLKLSDTIYRIPLLKYATNKVVGDMSNYFSASHFASYFASLPGVNLISAISRGVDRN